MSLAVNPKLHSSQFHHNIDEREGDFSYSAGCWASAGWAAVAQMSARECLRAIMRKSMGRTRSEMKRMMRQADHCSPTSEVLVVFCIVDAHGVGVGGVKQDVFKVGQESE